MLNCTFDCHLTRTCDAVHEACMCSHQAGFACMRTLDMQGHDCTSLSSHPFVLLHTLLSPAKRHLVILGRKLSMPIIVAPMSQQRMANDEGELAVARAVAKEGTAMVSHPIKLLSWQVLYTFESGSTCKSMLLLDSKRVLCHCCSISTMLCSACAFGKTHLQCTAAASTM